MTQPSLGDYFPIDADTIRTKYIKDKAARLAGSGRHAQVGRHRVVFMPNLSTTTTKRYVVHGDSRRYTVWLHTNTNPWEAACSRGGVHDMQPEGEACSHGLAAAVAYELSREATPA